MNVEPCLGVNLHGVFKTIRGRAASESARRRPHRSHTSTAASKTSPAVGTPYLAAKAAIAHLVRQLGVELARYRITVNRDPAWRSRLVLPTPELLPIFEQSSPSHRIGRPEEIEGVALFFCFRCLGFVTGAQTTRRGQLLGRAD